MSDKPSAAEQAFDEWWKSEYGPHMSKVSYLAAKSSWLAATESKLCPICEEQRSLLLGLSSDMTITCRNGIRHKLDTTECTYCRAEKAEAERDAAEADTIERCAKVAEGGRFLHDDAPDARFGKACAVAIRALSPAAGDKDERIGHEEAQAKIAVHVKEIEILCDCFGYDPAEFLASPDYDLTLPSPAAGDKVLVPGEPTVKMLEAAGQAYFDAHDRPIYAAVKAALAAAKETT